MNKMKTKILDFLPVLALLLWTVINVGTALFYTFQYYHLVNILVNVVGCGSFWLSIKYHNKYLNS